MDHDTSPEHRIAAAVGRARDREQQSARSAEQAQERWSEDQKRTAGWLAAWSGLREHAWAAATDACEKVGPANYVFEYAPDVESVELTGGDLAVVGFVLMRSGAVEGDACRLTLQADGEVRFDSDLPGLIAQRFSLDTATKSACFSCFADFIAPALDAQISHGSIRPNEPADGRGHQVHNG
jgi:hypothetical protein